MKPRRERIREGLEIDFDLLDSDVVRWYLPNKIVWKDIYPPLLVWMEHADDEDWTEGQSTTAKVMTRTLDDEDELAEGRRMVRLTHYKSYACLAELATRTREPGEFVIRKPPVLGHPMYVCDLDEARIPPGFGDPDAVGFEDRDFGFEIIGDLDFAQRFTHDQAIRLTIRIMEVLGYDIPGDCGDYYEPIRADIAEELHVRSELRPRRREALSAVVDNVSREP